jgi:hypothetical protein
MRDIEGIEKVVEKLKPHFQEIESHFEQENEKFKVLLAHDHGNIGRVLKCHLMIEHYLDHFLRAHYEIEHLTDVRLSFSQKAKMLPDKASAAAFIKPGVFNLNSVRNKLSHELNYNVQVSDMPKIIEILKIARKNIVFNNPIEAIEAFTTVACTWLIIPPANLQKLFIEAFSEIRVNVSDAE